MLLLVAALAVVIANTPGAAAFEALWQIDVGVQFGELDYGRSVRASINDAAMTLFFFVVALELKRELALGELRNPRMAALSIAAAAGGMIVPASIYLALQGGEIGHAGWGTVMATDTAFVVACLALLRERIPQSLRVFMLSLAIVDDVGAIVVVAVGYGHGFHWGALALAGAVLAAVALMRRVGLRAFAPYTLAGIVLWLAVDASGVHATVAGVVLGLLTPARRWVSDERLYAILERVVAHPPETATSATTKDRKTLQVAEIAARESLSPVERLEIALHPWVGFIVMPLFAFANAGLPLSGGAAGSAVTWAIVAGLALGKPLGVLSFTWLAVQSRVAERPLSLRWRFIAAARCSRASASRCPCSSRDAPSIRRCSTTRSSASTWRRWSRRPWGLRCYGRARGGMRPSSVTSRPVGSATSTLSTSITTWAARAVPARATGRSLPGVSSVRWISASASASRPRRESSVAARICAYR